MPKLSPCWLRALLTAPAALWSYEALTSDNARIFHILVHPTGEWPAWALIFTIMISPLVLFSRNAGLAHWLRKNRRYFGVAAFGYAALHTLFYLLDKGSAARVLSGLPRFYIWTGWLAFAIFIPLAITSMDQAQRMLGRWWKWLQRWTYAAAVLTLLHWAGLHEFHNPLGALLHFAPLAALEAYRLWYWQLRPSQRRANPG